MESTLAFNSGSNSMNQSFSSSAEFNSPVPETIPKSEEDTFVFATLLTSASALPMALKSALELDLLEIIAKAGPGAFVSTSEIAAQITKRNPKAPVMLDRILRLLATYDVVKCSLRDSPDGGVERLYGLGPVCKYLTRNEDGVSVAPLLLMNQDKVPMESWHYLKEAVLDGGIAFNKAFAMPAFDYHSPKFIKVHNEHTSGHSKITMKKILEVYKDFEGLTSIVDVGGGTGAALNMIISKYPTIKGINFDLSHVIDDAPSYPFPMIC